MTRRYAETTQVPVDRSRAAIERLLHLHAATSFVYGWDETHDRMQFVMNGRSIRFILPRPVMGEVVTTKRRRGRPPSPVAAQKAFDQAGRQRWRALYLVIRAKLEAVEAGIAVFDQEFLAFILGPDGRTVGDMIVPQLTERGGWSGRLLLGKGDSR